MTSNSRKVVSVLLKLFYWLNIKHTNTTLNNLKLHPNHPSIDALQDVLHEMNINNLVVRLSVDELQDIPLPALAHFSREGGSFVVLKSIYNELVTYYDSEYGMVTEAQQAFSDKWSGVLLLAEKNATSGEPNYKHNKKQERFETYSKYALVLLSVCILASVSYFASAIVLFHLILSLSGLGIAFALLQKQYGVSNAWVDSFCKLGSKTNCDEVLNTSYTKLFGIIHLSEVCTWYFSGTVLSLLMSAFASMPILTVLFIISCLTLPIVIFSLYFQSFIIKKWCPLCVAVVAILIFDFGSHLFSLRAFSIQVEAMLLVSVCFTALLIPWLLLRKSSLLSLKVETLQKKVLNFTLNHEVFQHLLQTNPTIEVSQLPHEVSRYSHDSLIDIVLVTNPTCQPCARTHGILERITEQFQGKINLVHRFSFNPKTPHLLTNKMLRHLFTLLLSRGNEQAEGALRNWFKSGQHNFEQWKSMFPSGSANHNSEIESLLSLHFEWCQVAGVTKTPTIFINGRELPE